MHDISKKIPADLFTEYKSRLIIYKIKMANIKKFENLSKHSKGNIRLCNDNKKLFLNESSVEIPQDISHFFCL